ncbi:MAG: hypothetical protein JKY46_04980 [Robiginitomaculum sp.]|nr:hypothetical protein [Robiginitomaculum sp.]
MQKLLAALNEHKTTRCVTRSSSSKALQYSRLESRIGHKSTFTPCSINSDHRIKASFSSSGAAVINICGGLLKITFTPFLKSVKLIAYLKLDNVDISLYY